MDQCAKYTGGTTWVVLAINPTTYAVTGYASLALLNAAGARAFPALDPGMFAAHLVLQTEDNSDNAVAGAGCYVAINRGAEFSGLASDAARDAVATVIPTSVILTWPAWNPVSVIPVSNVWVRLKTGTDLFHCTAIIG